MSLTRLLAIAALLTLPATARAQGGFLKKMKEKAAEQVAKKAGDAIDKVAGGKDTAAADTAKATAAASEGAGPSRAAAKTGSLRREKPGDPTQLESPGYRPPAGAQPQPQQQQAQPQQGKEALNERSWHDTPQSLEAFAAGIPTITDEVLDRYIRARTAMQEEAKRLTAMKEAARTRETVQAFRALAGPPLADDERIPILRAQPYQKIARMLRPEYERRLDAVAERELGGALTRLQFYQLHEVVQIYVHDDLPDPAKPKARGPGRDLTRAELAALAKRRDELQRLEAERKAL